MSALRLLEFSLILCRTFWCDLGQTFSFAFRIWSPSSFLDQSPRRAQMPTDLRLTLEVVSSSELVPVPRLFPTSATFIHIAHFRVRLSFTMPSLAANLGMAQIMSLTTNLRDLTRGKVKLRLEQHHRAPCLFVRHPLIPFRHSKAIDLGCSAGIRLRCHGGRRHFHQPRR